MSHCTEKFLSGKIVLQKISGFEKYLYKRGRHTFVDFFCLTVQKKFRKVTIVIQKKLWYRKFSCIRGGNNTIFRRNFLSQSTENIPRGTVFRINLVPKNFIQTKKGVSRFSIVYFWKVYAKAGIRTRSYRFQSPIVLSTVPQEQLLIVTIVSEIMKLSDTTEIRMRTYCLRNFCPNPTADIHFWKEELAKLDTKEKNDPTECKYEAENKIFTLSASKIPQKYGWVTLGFFGHCFSYSRSTAGVVVKFIFFLQLAIVFTTAAPSLNLLAWCIFHSTSLARISYWSSWRHLPGTQIFHSKCVCQLCSAVD